jgi:Fe2+ transport system protein FeoA
MRSISPSDGARPLSALRPGQRGSVHHLRPHPGDRVDRLHALGVTHGAPITVLQTAPSFVFLCDQTELAVERVVADAIYIEVSEE